MIENISYSNMPVNSPWPILIDTLLPQWRCGVEGKMGIPNQMLMPTLNSAPMIERPSELKGGTLSQILTSGELEGPGDKSLLWISKVEKKDLKTSASKSAWREVD